MLHANASFLQVNVNWTFGSSRSVVTVIAMSLTLDALFK